MKHVVIGTAGHIDHGKTLIVDAMSSFGGVPLSLSQTPIDVLISSANKCIEGVPGFGFVIIRRELLTNILALRGQARELTEFGKYRVATELGKNAAIEIELLEAFKLRRLNVEDIEVSFLAKA